MSTTSAYSLDGKHYAVGFSSGYIIVFNTSKWDVDCFFQDSKKSIGAVAFSPDSKLLAYGDSIGIVRTRQHPIDITVAPASFQAHSDFISDLAFSPNGLKIATASVDNRIGLWDAASGNRVWPEKSRHRGVSSVAFSPDANPNLLVSGGSDKTIRLWDVGTGQLTHTLKGHKGAISKVLFSPNGTQIASASSDKTVRVWSVTTKTCDHTFAGHSDRVTSIAFSPDGQRLVSCSEDSTIRTWEPRSGGTGPIYRGHKSQVVCIAYSRDGKQFATCGRDKTLRRWDCRTATKGAVIFGRTNTVSSGMYPYSTVKRGNNVDSNKTFKPTLQYPHAFTSQSGSFEGPFEGHGKVIAISPDGLLTATPCANPFNVQLWHKGTNNQPSLSRQLIGHRKKISCIVFSPDNQHIASGSFDGTTKIWDTRSGALVCTLMGKKSKVTSLAFSPAGQQIVTGSEDGTVRLWDEFGSATPTEEKLEGVASTRRCLATFEDKKNSQSVTSVAISPSGQWVASGGEGGAVRLWYANSHDNNSVNLEGHRDPVNSIVFSPDNKHIASGSDDGTVRIWDIDNKREVRSLPHGGNVKCLVYMSSGKQLASGGDNCKIWDVETGEVESELHHDRAVVSIVSFLDSLRLWTGTEDRKVQEWRSDIAGRDTTLVSTTAFSVDSRLVASSLGGNDVHLWNTESGEHRAVLSGHSSSIECLSFSPTSNLLASASSDKTVGIWDLETGERLETLEGHRGIIISVTFSPKGNQIATVSMDQTLRLWNLSESAPGCRLRVEAQGFKVDEQPVPPQAEEEGTVVQAGEQGNNPHAEEQVEASQAGEQGTSVQAAEQGDALRVTEQEFEDHMDHQSPTTQVDDQDSAMQIDDQDSAEQVDEPLEKQGAPLNKSMLEPYYHDTSGLAHTPVYSPDGKEVSVISAQHGILRFDTQTGASLRPLIDKNDKNMATCIAYSPRGGRMATSSEDNMVRIWDPETGNILFELDGHTASVTSVAFSPFRYQLATSSADGTVCLWKVMRDAQEANDLRLRGHDGPVLCVAYSPDGKFLASGSADRTMRLWNPADGELLAIVGDFAVGVKTIQWKVARGRLLLVTGCKENLPQVWELVEGIRGGKYEVLRYWGVGVDALAVSGARIGKDHGLGAENSTLLRQRNAEGLA
ncbi:MAG: quinon protein alcohol dehydrogenase-like superfamily [Linnemannia gamsii]|nr:MAG: quinon protein alcohol dehydrogenase-like superfamily [Linnemannia gamsii]